MWVKICGNTNLDDARHAAIAGADALGFVFAPSPRQVTAEVVSSITPHLPQNVETYGVFVSATAEEIVQTVSACRLSGVQLHRSNESNLANSLRQRFSSLGLHSIKIIKAIHFDESLQQQLSGLDTGIDAVLIDTKSAAKAGGTGKVWEWSAAAGTLQRFSNKIRVIAAGGLDPRNVTQAIQTISPWGVDVVSGVETSPGRKDQHRVEAFIHAAKGKGASVTIGAAVLLDGRLA